MSQHSHGPRVGVVISTNTHQTNAHSPTSFTPAADVFPPKTQVFPPKKPRGASAARGGGGSGLGVRVDTGIRVGVRIGIGISVGVGVREIESEKSVRSGVRLVNV